MNVVLVGSKIDGPFYHTYEENKQWAQVMCKRTLSINMKGGCKVENVYAANFSFSVFSWVGHANNT